MATLRPDRCVYRVVQVLVAACWCLTLLGCAPASTDGGGLSADEQRLLPRIVGQEEARVREAAQAVATAQDRATALRLRQRMLTQHGRTDLADALEPQAVEAESELVRQRQRLADEEAALAAYRAYATQTGVRVPSRGS